MPIQQLKPHFFYHFQKAINQLWQSQNFQGLDDDLEDLIDKVFLIEDYTQKISFFVIFTEKMIQIYPQYPSSRPVDVKIVFDTTEIFEFMSREALNKLKNKDESKDEPKDQGTEDKSKDELLSKIKIYGDAYLAKKLVVLIDQVNFNFLDYADLFIPKPLLALLKQIPIESFFNQLLKQILGTINNLAENRKRHNQERS